MAQYPDASSGSITDVSTCWSLCLQLVLNGKECMAAVLESSTAVCKLYVGTELLSESAIQTASSAGSTVMLRRCFECMYNNNNKCISNAGALYDYSSVRLYVHTISQPLASPGISPPLHFPITIDQPVKTSAATKKTQKKHSNTAECYYCGHSS